MKPMRLALPLLLAGGLASADAFQPSPHDFLPRKPAARAAAPTAAMATAAAEAPDGSMVTHTTGDGFTLQFRKFNGRRTSLLIPQADLDRVGLARARKLIDEHDLVYETYMRLVGEEPTGEGLARVVIVPPPATLCVGLTSGGCALPGTKGIEIMSGVLDLPDYLHYVIHETGHTFDRYSHSLFSAPDAYHSWTGFFDAFVMFQLGQSNHGLDEADYLAHYVRTHLGPYESHAGASWAACIRDQACDPAGHRNAHWLSFNAEGAALARIASLFGKGPMASWMTHARAVLGERGWGQTPEVKSEILVESLSRAVGADLSCVFDRWGWPMTWALRQRLSAYGANPVCADADFDGHSRAAYDCDDADAARRPGAAETVNGKDDDCNRGVDDVLVREAGDHSHDVGAAPAVPFPARIVGDMQPGDWGDCARFTVPAAASVQFTWASRGAYQGWSKILRVDAWQERAALFVWPGDVNTRKVELEAGEYAACIEPDQPGEYEMTLARGYAYPMAEDFHPVTFTPAAGSASHGGRYLLPVPPLPPALAGRTGLTAHYWISGYGEVGSLSAPSATPFVWTAPAGRDPLASTFRVTYRSAGTPVHAWSQHQSLLGAAGWASQDIGSVGIPGSLARFGEQELAVRASGADIWGGSDGFRFTYLPLEGNGEVTAKVHSLAAGHAAVKAGVMIRETLLSGSRNVFVGLQGASQAAFQVRAATSGTTTNVKRAAAAPLWVRLTRNGNVFAAYTSADGSTWSQLGASTTLALPAKVHAGLAVTSHDNAVLTSAGFGHATVRAYAALPSPWVSRDIGSTGLAGSATYAAGTFTLAGAGADIWGTADAFRFAYFPVVGNVTLTARLTGLQNTHAWAKAGLMIRESLAAGAKNAFMAVTPTSGVTFQRRTTTGGATASTPGSGAAPKWLRVVRAGNVLTGQVSDNGLTWTTLGSATVGMSSQVYVGMAVTSHNNAATATATWTQVSAQ